VSVIWPHIAQLGYGYPAVTRDLDRQYGGQDCGNYNKDYHLFLHIVLFTRMLYCCKTNNVLLNYVN
jgi:hypothetical protein